MELDIIVGDITNTSTTTVSNTTTITASTTTTSTEKNECLAEELYGVHSQETALLRCVRDKLLKKTPEGQEIISLYYQWSPLVAKAIKDNNEFKKLVKELIDGILLIKGEEE